MAYTKEQLEAISNSELASAQTPPIAASKHRTVNQALLDELYDNQALANKLSTLTELTSPAADDLIFVIRGGVGYLISADTLDFVQQLVDLSDVSVTDPNDGDVLYFNSTSGKWESRTISEVSGGVTFVDSRNALPATGVSDVLYITKGGAVVNLTITNPNFDGSISPWFTISDGGTTLLYLDNYIYSSLNNGQVTRWVRQDLNIKTIDRNSDITFNVPVQLRASAPFAAYNATVEVAIFNNTTLLESFTRVITGSSGVGNSPLTQLVQITGNIDRNLVFDIIAFRVTNNSGGTREVRFGTMTQGVSVSYLPKQAEFYYWTGTEFVNIYRQQKTAQVDTEASNFILDFKGNESLIFTHSDAISSTKNLDYANDENALSYKFLVEISDIAGVIYFPSNTICSAAGWVSIDKLFVPPVTGFYKFSAEYDGTNWWLEVSETFN